MFIKCYSCKKDIEFYPVINNSHLLKARVECECGNVQKVTIETQYAIDSEKEEEV